MFYLALTIIATIIIVAITIRRLPYLRPTRLGLEIASPKPYIMQRSSSWQNVLDRAFSFVRNLGKLRNRSIGITFQSGPLIRQSYTPPETSVSVESRSPLSFREETTAPAVSQTAHPDDFWKEEAVPSSGPLEIPSRGLISRRGEAQKIAHELIAQADECFRKKDYKTAEKHYLQAATKDPDNARIYNRLGVIYLHTKNYKDAVEAFKGALKFDDRVASRHYNLALAYMGKHDYKATERCLKEALRLEPTNEKYRKTLEAIQRQPVA